MDGSTRKIDWRTCCGAVLILLAVAGVARAEEVDWTDDFDSFELDTDWEDSTSYFQPAVPDTTVKGVPQHLKVEKVSGENYLRMVSALTYFTRRAIGTIDTFNICEGKIEVDFTTGAKSGAASLVDSDNDNNQDGLLELFLVNETTKKHVYVTIFGSQGGTDRWGYAGSSYNGSYVKVDTPAQVWEYETSYRFVIETRTNPDETVASFFAADDLDKPIFSHKLNFSLGSFGPFHVVLSQDMILVGSAELYADASVDRISVKGTNDPLTSPIGDLPEWTAGQDYGTRTLTVTDGTLDMKWEVTGLPAGLTHDASDTRTLTVSGTPTTAGMYPVTVKVTDHYGSTASSQFTIVINKALEGPTGSLVDWTRDQEYEARTFTVTGGTLPITWRLTGTLPKKMSYTPDGRTLTIEGTPLELGSFTVMVTATDDAGASVASAPQTIVINPPVQPPSGDLPDWTVDRAYVTRTLSVGDGEGTLDMEWTVVGDLPTGLTHDAKTATSRTLTITGTPIAPGAYDFSVTVTDRASSKATVTFTVTINKKMEVAWAELTSWTLGQPYEERMSLAAEGTEPITWTTSPLPKDLEVQKLGRVHIISGTPTETGNNKVTLTARDAAGSVLEKTFTIDIMARPTVPAGDLPTWTQLLPFAPVTLSTTGGLETIEWTVTGLPPIMTSTPAGARSQTVTGTPTSDGDFTVVVTVRDHAGATATRSMPLRINPALTPPAGTLPAWTEGMPYAATSLVTTGGTPPLSWSVSGLPSGMEYEGKGETLVVSETPGVGTAGPHAVTVTVTDTLGATATNTIPLLINAKPEVIGDALSDWTVNLPYEAHVFLATGGTDSITWTVTDLPTGLKVTIYDRLLIVFGTPTEEGEFTTNLEITDGAKSRVVRTFPVSINAALTQPAGDLVDWTEGIPYVPRSLTTTGGTGDPTWEVTGLPEGLGEVPAGRTCSIEGTPTETGLFLVTVTVSEARGDRRTNGFLMKVNEKPTLTGSLPDWTAGRAYGPHQFVVDEGTGTITWEVSGLPAWLKRTPDGRALSVTGTPSGSGTHEISLRATDGPGAAATLSLTLRINDSVQITTKTLLPWTIDRHYTRKLEYTGGTPSHGWKMTSGVVPGLSLDSKTGIYSGFPSVDGTYKVGFEVRDAAGSSHEKKYDLVVNPGLALSAKTLLYASEGEDYVERLPFEGGTAPLTFEVVSGTLPAWAALNPGTGDVEGTALSPPPGESGLYAFSVKVRDDTGAESKPRAYELRMAQLFPIDTGGAEPFTVRASDQGLCLLAFDALRGSGLTLKIKRPDRGLLTGSSGGSVRFVTADGTPLKLSVSPKIKIKSKSISIKKFLMPHTGRCFLEIATVVPAQGADFAAAIQTKLKYARKFTGAAEDQGGVEEFGFAAPPGSSGSIKVKGSVGELLRVYHVESGTNMDLTGGGSSFALPALTSWGEYRVEVRGATGASFMVKLKTKKPGK